MSKGYMCLSRERFIEFEWISNPIVCYFFFRLLMKANYKDGRQQGVEIKRGQILTGRRALSVEFNLTERQVRTCLDRLKNGHYIDQQTTNKYTIITICDYDSWQDYSPTNDQQNVQQTTNKRPTNDHIRNKENKGSKENKEYKPSSFHSDGSSHGDTDGTHPKTFREQVIVYFNERMTGKNIPQINNIADSTKRAEMLRARMKEYGKEAIFQMIDNAAESKFLNGDNQKNFVATFDWLIRPNNFPKVLEGNYNDREKQDRQKEKVDEKMAVGQILTPSREEWGKVKANEFFNNKP